MHSESSKPILIVIAGPNGSWKTSVTNQLLKHHWIENCVYINPDQIAEDEFGGWNNIDAIYKAAKIAEERRENCIKENKSLIFETVFSANDKIDFIKKAISNGYFIRFFFIGTNHPEINAKRITNRVLEGGHDVPITKIITRYSKSISNCTIISNIVDRLYVYDNSIDFSEAKLLFRTSNGKLLKKYSDINEWAKPIYKSIK